MRFPSLDGLRGCAISAVILSHSGLPERVPGLWRLDIGHFGVRVFFVLSGFLITTLLLYEQAGTGAVNFKAFYVRRLLRIFPPFYLFLATMAILIYGGLLPAINRPLWPAALYVADYIKVPLEVGHSWSLAVEEQFYLLWPGLLVFLGKKRALVGCAIILVISPLRRLAIDIQHSSDYARYAFLAVSDALATGCMLAILRDRLWQSNFYKRLIKSPAPLILTCAALIFDTTRRFYVSDVVAISLLNIGVAVTIDKYLRYPGSLGGRILNCGPVVWLGLTSYSIYLWQQPFMYSHLPLLLQLAGTFSCVISSYYLLERPLQLLRRRFEVHYSRSNIGTIQPPSVSTQ